MNRFILCVSLFAASLVSTIIDGYSQTMSLSAIYRPRGEVMYGYRFPPDTIGVPQFIISHRARLIGQYGSDRFSAYLSLQDARTWGDEVTPADVPSVAMQQVWAQYNFSKSVGLKIGRQELMYDNKRLLTDGNWIQTGRSYDAATLKIALKNNWKIDVVGSYNQQTTTYFGNYYNLSNPKTLDVLWINKSRTDTNFNYNVSALVLGDGWQTPDTTGVFMRYTYGLNTAFDWVNWGINLEGYGQSGKTRTINQSGNIVPDSFQTVKAFMFSVNPWVNLFEGFRVGVGLDYLSGSDALDTTRGATTNLFNPQFGAAHRYYGRMDIFFNVPQATRNGGLIDGYLKLQYMYKGWEFYGDYHYFLLEDQVEDVENPGTALSQGLGSEIDLWLSRDITKAVNFMSGIHFLFPTRSLEFVKTASFSQVGSPTVTGVWFFAMLTFKPVFFSK
jgi:hypothetical protein